MLNLTFLAPPLVGAFIGYMTNYVAIRMLFRPLKTWRFFGVRVPMTPGVIPSKRHDLARNIGRMVGSHLLTSSDVSKALTQRSFRRELELVVVGRVNDILQRDLGPLPTLIPDRFRSYFEAGIKILRWRALRLMHSHLDSPAFAAHLAETISHHLAEFLAKDLNSLIPSENREHFFAYLDTTISKLTKDPKAEEWINLYIDKKTKEILDAGQSIQDLVPEQFIEILLSLLEKEAPNLLEKAAHLAGEPDMRQKMVGGICGAIDSFIASLGPMAALAGSFLSPDVIEEKVTSYLEEKGDDIKQWLQSDVVLQKISSVIREKAESLFSQPISYHLAGIAPDKMKEVRRGIARQLTILLQNPKTTAALTAMIRDAIETQAERPVGDMLADLFGAEGVQKGKHWTSDEIITIIRSPKVKRILDNLVITIVEKNLLTKPIGALANLLPKAVQSGFGEYLLQQTTDLLASEVPGLVDSLNIEQIVTRKVDSLDLLHLERLLLSIMEEQFKYINMFGGLLGFIIGLLNLIFLLH